MAGEGGDGIRSIVAGGCEELVPAGEEDILEEDVSVRVVVDGTDSMRGVGNYGFTVINVTFGERIRGGRVWEVCQD